MTAAALTLLAAGLLAVHRLTRRAQPLRPARVEPSNVTVIRRPGQPGENEGERAGLVGRETGRAMTSPSSPSIDFAREVGEAPAVGDGRDLARRVQLGRGTHPAGRDMRATLRLLDGEQGAAR